MGRKKKFREKVLALHEKWRRRLCLTWWEGTLCINDYLSGQDGNNTLADCTADWKYQTYTIRINRSDAMELSDGELEKMIIHELLHVVVNEMREGDVSHEERVVTNLETAITGLISLNA